MQVFDFGYVTENIVSYDKMIGLNISIKTKVKPDFPIKISLHGETIELAHKFVYQGSNFFVKKYQLLWGNPKLDC